jgi:multidrug efflux system outer membrane protein
LDTKALVALTGLAESELIQKVKASPNKGSMVGIAIKVVPAQTLAQRPDVFAAERDVVVASIKVGNAKAQRYPRLMLSGSLGTLRFRSTGLDSDTDTWSFGPLAISMPIFDAGQRAANIDLAHIRYAEAVIVYRSKVRQAVREVEYALINLQSTHARTLHAAVAKSNYAESLRAMQTRYEYGFASRIELEETRRITMASQTAQLILALEQKRAWIALYRALGGGFQPIMSSD